jgi:hypothetical protein
VSNTETVNSGTTLPDPEMYLMQVAIDTQQGEIGIQAGFSSLLALQSAAATYSLNQAQAIASGFASQMKKDSTASAMQTDNAIYNTMMTMISDATNKYQTIESGGATIATSLNQAQAQSLQLCQVVVEFLGSMSQLITMIV